MSAAPLQATSPVATCCQVIPSGTDIPTEATPAPAAPARGLFFRLVRCTLALLSGLVLFPAVGCRRGPDGSSRGEVTAPAVEAVQARSGALPLVERVSGTVRADNQITLFPEISGRVLAVHVQSGDPVERGQALVEIQADELREQLRQAEAGYRVNEARLRQARARLGEMQAQDRRTRALAGRELVTEFELESLAAELESARADVALAEAQLDEAGAAVAEQREMLTKAVVRAPIRGHVGQRNAEIGMQVTPTTRLFTIGNLDRVEVRVNISDTMLRHVAQGQPVRIVTRDAAGQTRHLLGRLERISPFLDEVTRSADAEIEIENPDHWLHAGMFVPVDLLYGESRQATLVPSSALFTDPNTGTVGVFILDKGGPGAGSAAASQEARAASARISQVDPPALSDPVAVRFRPVGIVARGEMEVAVSDVQPGDWVVTIGQDLLSTGRNLARVEEVSWEHVMELQGLEPEDLLQEALQATKAPATS